MIANNECSANADYQKSSANSPTHHHHSDNSSVDSRTSSSLSDVGESTPRDATLVALRTKSRLKFKSTENLLHRLFVCIAGVADQLQTNFASDLRHILRSVFLMNMSVTQDDELDIPEKTKESELFEFRASENDVIQESSNGSNQSIYSAEEVNPELDNVFNNNQNHNSNSSSRSSMSSAESTGNANNQNNNNNTIRHSTGSSIQRVSTMDLGGANDATANSNLLRNHVERSRSLGDHEQQHDNNGSNSRSLSAYISGRRLSASITSQTNNNAAGNTTATASNNNSAAQRHQQLQRHRNNSVGSNSPGSSSSSSSSSESNSPISERASNTRCSETISNQHHQQNHGSNTATAASNNNNGNNININNNTQRTTTTCLAPPAWVPDDRAPRCMSCHTQFTAFRRRHHCRNCGGVFCSVCSNASAPLPKYGLTKAVRVCRDCYVREVRGAARSTQTQMAAAAAHHQSVNTATAGGS